MNKSTDAPIVLEFPRKEFRCPMCAFFQQTDLVDDGRGNKVAVGFCRYNPPMPLVPVAALPEQQRLVRVNFTSGQLLWPLVTGQDWCRPGRVEHLAGKEKAE